MVKALDPSLLAMAVDSPTWVLGSQPFGFTWTKLWPKVQTWNNKGIVLLSWDCMIARPNTCNILWNILFHCSQQMCSPFLICLFALERRDLTLVESVTLKLGPCNSYGGDFSYIYFQMQIEPFSNTFGLLRNSGSVPLLEHVPCYLVKLGCALLAWSSSIFQGDFFPYSHWVRIPDLESHCPESLLCPWELRQWPRFLSLISLEFCVLQFLDT